MSIKELSLAQKKRFLTYAINKLIFIKANRKKLGNNSYGNYFICNIFDDWMMEEVNSIIGNRVRFMMPYFPELATEIYKTAIRINGSGKDKDIPITYKNDLTGRVGLLTRVRLRLH